jgi:hypothetical protein
MTQQKTRLALNLEVHEVERQCKPGCGSSTTSNLCTCPISITSTGDAFSVRR